MTKVDKVINEYRVNREVSLPPSKASLHFYFRFLAAFAVFRLYRVHLGDLSIYFIDFLLLVEHDLWSISGCFFSAKSSLYKKFGVTLVLPLFSIAL